MIDAVAYDYCKRIIEDGCALVPRRYLQPVLDTLSLLCVWVDLQSADDDWFLLRRSNLREEK